MASPDRTCAIKQKGIGHYKECQFQEAEGMARGCAGCVCALSHFNALFLTECIVISMCRHEHGHFLH